MILIFHRLLLEVARDWMGEDARALWGEAAVRLVSKAFPFDVLDNPATWPLCARLMPHVMPLEAQAPRTDVAGKALDRLLHLAGLYLSARGDREEALALVERSVALMRQTQTDDPLYLAAGLNNLARRYDDLDRLVDAEKANREALEMKEAHLAANDPNLAITLTNLAALHQRRKDFAQAETLFIRAAEIMKAAHGPGSAVYGTLLSNLGALYSEWANEPGQATRRAQEEIYKTQALAVTRAARGERHPETANGHNNLAVLETYLGDWLSAAAEAERSTAIMLSLNLFEHPNTQLAAGVLTHIWQHCGQPDKAARLQKGDFSDLLPVIAQIEAEHRAWVAEDPENRHFGPPSPFASEQ
jgi:tetratricopeptide (TPR) repeat protein